MRHIHIAMLRAIVAIPTTARMDRNMAHFIISFRIKSDSDYQSRYDSFRKRVEAISNGIGGVWEETSSFYAIEAKNTAQGLCYDLYLNTEFDPSKDIMLVVDVKNQEQATKGEIKYPNSLASALGF
ncbi:hypothetical protein [Janthinobacterium sp. SUN206]|uniref:hypothetical protein n=1 Tax=Janthinobacterium sp. SUN206 TaxID=3014787 RepID=UPI002713BF2B|nr:hypothetical protein [Janthinobacterium sp. SUN206]MDO8065572.1 hypothetical protein [Janthinobacterium sp. SUN206]